MNPTLLDELRATERSIERVLIEFREAHPEWKITSVYIDPEPALVTISVRARDYRKESAAKTPVGASSSTPQVPGSRTSNQ